MDDCGRCSRWDGVGVTPRELAPGTAVMVPVGQISAVVNGGPCVIAWAVVRGPADDDAVRPDGSVKPGSLWWLDVFAGPGVPPLPQMYRADTILGVPALGVGMDGAPERDRPVR